MSMTGTARRWSVLPAFLAAVAVTAVIGGLAAADAGDTYLALDRPSWAPPQWLFGPAWTVLYVMIGISGWLLYTKAGWTNALTAYAVQLVLNAAWTPLFFGADRFGLAFADIVLLWIAIAATLVLAWRISRPAALLLVPYLGWVSYAAALNLAIWQMN